MLRLPFFSKKTRFSTDELPDLPGEHKNETMIQAWGQKYKAIRHCKIIRSRLRREDDIEQMDFVIKVLKESHHFAADQSMNSEFAKRGTTEDVQSYIMKNMMGTVPTLIIEESSGNLLVPTEKTAHQREQKSKRMQDISKSIKSTKNADDLKTIIFNHVISKIGGAGSSRPVSQIQQVAVKLGQMPSITDEAQLNAQLEKIDSWLDFDIFEVAKLSSNRPLIVVVTHILKKYDLLNKCNIEETCLLTFLTAVEDKYPNTNPYHCSTHAADVVQTMNALLVKSNLISRLSPTELLACFIGAAIHDIDHPALSNNFLIQIRSPLATTYNDSSVLENHHLATFFRVLRLPGCNIFENLSEKDRREVRKNIIDMVMATDIVLHVQLLDDFSSLTETTTPDIAALSASGKKLLLKIAMHISDISNPAKSFPICSEWASRVMEEFYFQGDLEDCLGMPVSRECDRAKAAKEHVQVGFIDYVVRPLLDVWIKWFPEMMFVHQQMESNFLKWKE